jgi:hypothetical protein
MENKNDGIFVYDASARIVSALADRVLPAGKHFIIDIQNAACGY